MPLALLAALAGSLAIHVAALFGTDYELFGEEPEQVILRAEIKPLPQAQAAKVPPKPAAKAAPKRQVQRPAPVTPAESGAALPAEPPEANPSPAPEAPALASEPEAAAAPVHFEPSAGAIRYAIYLGTQGFQIGRAEHRWEFTEDGHYRLVGTTETSGLVALFKSLRFEHESTGRVVAGGLQPDTYRVRKNGREANENADFDWGEPSVKLLRNGETRAVAPGTQDILSLNYQLAYYGDLSAGAHVGVVTGKKYDVFALDSLGEEALDLPAGQFKTLHLRAKAGDGSVTEIWIALDRQRLPVKIRYTDKKGDIYEQVATEIGSR